jgi:hypothetical protein
MWIGQLTLATGRNRAVIESLVQDAMDAYFKKDEGKTVVYSNSHGSWR